MKTTRKQFDMNEIHESAVTWMTVRGSVGGSYSVETDGFCMTATVHRSPAATCSFCGQEGHDVGSIKASAPLSVVYSGNEWDNE